MPDEAGRGALGGRRRRGTSRASSPAAAPTASPQLGALGPRRGRRPRARPLVLVPLPRRRRGEPGRPDPHRCRGRRPTSTALRLRLRLLPALRARATSPPTEHMAEEDLDLVLHLGDYIYEYGPARTARSGKHAGRRGRRRSTTTASATRSTRPTRDLQAVHAALPVARHLGRPRGRQQLRQRRLARRATPREPFLRRRAAAYQAYYEHMPLRAGRRAARPDMPLYRSLPVRPAAPTSSVLDTRQYRTDQPSGDGQSALSDAARDPQRDHPRRAPGATGCSIASRRRRHAGTCWPQQVMMARLDRVAGPPAGVLDGPVARLRRPTHRRCSTSSARGKVSEPGRPLRRHPLELGQRPPRRRPAIRSRPIVAAEFVGTSITSGRDGIEISPRNQAILPENPHVKFHNGQRGYVRCTIGRDRWTTDYRVVPFVSRPGASVETRASLVVENGRPGVHRA